MALTEEFEISSVEGASAARRVLIYGINYAPEPTGVGRYTGEIGSYLARQGVNVAVVTAIPHYPGWAVRDGYRNWYSFEQVDGAGVTRCPLLLKAEMHGIWRFLAPLTFAITSAPVAAWQILTKRPDTVFCIEPTLFCAPVALLAAKIVGAKTVLHVQDLEIDAAFALGHLSGRIFKKIASFAEGIILQAFDAVVTISNRIQDRLKLKGIMPKRLNLIRNWVDISKIKPLDRMSVYREELGLANGTWVALYAGNIGPKQALPIILDAAEKLVSDPRLVFVVVGDGPEKRSLIARYSHLANVHFLPVQPEERLCELLNLADVHLLPQDQQAADLVLPSKLGGMLASGKLCMVMASPGTELHDFLGDGAILLPPGNSDALASGLKHLLDTGRRNVAVANSMRLATLDAQCNLMAFNAILAPER